MPVRVDLRAPVCLDRLVRSSSPTKIAGLSPRGRGTVESSLNCIRRHTADAIDVSFLEQFERGMNRAVRHPSHSRAAPHDLGDAGMSALSADVPRPPTPPVSTQHGARVAAHPRTRPRTTSDGDPPRADVSLQKGLYSVQYVARKIDEASVHHSRRTRSHPSPASLDAR